MTKDNKNIYSLVKKNIYEHWDRDGFSIYILQFWHLISLASRLMQISLMQDQ